MREEELTGIIAERAQIGRKDAEAVLYVLKEIIAGELQRGGSVRLSGLGVFYVTERTERTVRLPMDGREIRIAPKRTVRWKPDESLKETINRSENCAI